jgi:hypothetical protein
VAEVIPFERKKVHPPASECSSTEVEAFFVTTDKIFFLAIVYMDNENRYHSNGYIIFEDGNKWYFTMDNNKERDVRKKCLDVGKRIAHVYGGDLQQGTIDMYGRFISLSSG